jgi:hypothetical protein
MPKKVTPEKGNGKLLNSKIGARQIISVVVVARIDGVFLVISRHQKSW